MTVYDLLMIVKIKNILRFLRISKKKKEKNLLREGLKIDKKLKDGFYYFIYEKNIDWAIILGSLFVILPYVPSKNIYFLFAKIIILCFIMGLAIKYLLTWNELRKLKEKQTEFKKVMIKLITPSKTEDSTKLLHKLTTETKILSEKVKKKAHLYKDFNDYSEHEKSDLKPIEDLINQDLETTKTAYGESISILASIFILREVPKLENRNYYRLIAVVLLVFLFFITYYFEFCFLY